MILKSIDKFLWYMLNKTLDQGQLDTHDEYSEAYDFVNEWVNPNGFGWLKHYAYPIGMPRKSVRELTEREFDSRWCSCGCYFR
jgi:hypothetical protein